MTTVRGALTWVALIIAVSVPLMLALASPLLAWRETVYIIAGFSGVMCLALLLLQPLLATGALPGLRGRAGRVGHRIVAVLLLAAVLVHVAGLWLTSPPDVIDALLLRSPTPFSIWGVIAMWAVFATTALAVFRPHFRPSIWRMAHGLLAMVIVGATVAHALLIDGTMEFASKIVLCVLVMLTLLIGLSGLRFHIAFARAFKRS